MKTILVTGGAGFIGSNYVLYMLKHHDDVRIVNLDKLTYAGNLENLREAEGDERHIFVQGDIGDAALVYDLLLKYKIKYIVNFAAESHVDRSIEDPGIFAQTNVMGTINLLTQARRVWESAADGAYPEDVKFLQVSTDEVYGSLGDTGYFTEETPLCPHSPYSASKASADMFVMAWYDTFGLPINITRCSNNYGPYQFPEKLIPLMIHNACQKKDLPVYGDGLNVRDWLYVDDHCKAIDMVLWGGKPGDVYNVGGHNERTNIAIVQRVIGLVHDKVDPAVSETLIKYVTDRKGHDRRYGIDPEKIRRELGWQPDTPFDEGIELTIDWYLGNDEWLQSVTSGAYMDYYDKMYKDR